MRTFTFYIKNIFLIHLLIWLSQVLVSALRIFNLRGSRQIPSCSGWDLVPRREIEPRPPALGARNLSQQGSLYFFYFSVSFE